MNPILFVLAGAVAVLAVIFAMLARFVGGRVPVSHDKRRILPWALCIFVGLGTLQLLGPPKGGIGQLVQYFCFAVLAFAAVASVFGIVRFTKFLPHLPSRRTVARVEQLVREERLNELEEELRREIEHEGPAAERLGVLGGCLGRQHKWDKAFEVFRQLNGREDTAGIYLSMEGFALWKLGHCEEALARLEEAVRKHPKDPIGWMRYAQVLADLGKLDEAERALARAEELYAPYRDSRGAWRLGWVKLFAETCDQVERARILAQSAKRLL